MKQFNCPLCGESSIEKRENDIFYCKHCGNSFRDEFVKIQFEAVKSALGAQFTEQKEEQIANARYNLWNAAHEEYTDSEKILGCCRELKKYLPKDFQANFYEIANSGTARELNRFLDATDAKKYASFLPDVIDFAIKSLELKNVSAVKSLIERAYPKHTKEYNDYTTKVEDEAARLEEGLYLTTVPRDVFLAYSSADMGAVNEVAEYLESQGLKCYVALRNLRHGRGATENYEERIFEAMRNCKCFVFLSSEHSRSIDCDAIKVEIPYLKQSLPNMPRTQYLLEDYGKRTTDAAKLILKDAFKGLEWNTNKEDLLASILKAVTAQPKNAGRSVKYCLACGTENPFAAKRCMECGETAFTESYKDYLDVKAEEQRKKDEAEFQEKQKRLEEEAKKKQKELEAQLEKERAAWQKKQQEELADIERKRQEAIAVAEEEAKNRSFKYCMECGAQNLKNAKFCCECAKTVFGTLEEYRAKAEEAEHETNAETERKQKEAKERKRLEAERKKKEEYPTLENYNHKEFEIEGTLLKKYLGKGGAVKIPLGVTEIVWSAFSGCSSLTGITIPKSVTSIGNSAFHNCSKLTGIVIPNGVTSIGLFAFDGCSGLTSVIIPDRESINDLHPIDFI